MRQRSHADDGHLPGGAGQVRLRVRRSDGPDRPQVSLPAGRGGERGVLLRLPLRDSPRARSSSGCATTSSTGCTAPTAWPRPCREELGIQFGETTPTGKFTLEHTPCIGMCDQAPAALVNDVVVTNLTPTRPARWSRRCARHGDPAKLVAEAGRRQQRPRPGPGHGPQQHPQEGAGDLRRLRARRRRCSKALAMTPGGGHPRRQDRAPARPRRRGLPHRHEVGVHPRPRRDKRSSSSATRDEGEPGTFKDRVILTECPDLLFEGMTIAGYAIGADSGILYLRGEYAYLQAFLENVLAERRAARACSGKNICGKDGLRLRHPHPDGRRRLRLRRGDRADQLVRGAARRPQEPPAVPGPEGLPRLPDRRSTTSRPSAASRASSTRAPAGSPRWAPRAARAPSC